MRANQFALYRFFHGVVLSTFVLSLMFSSQLSAQTTTEEKPTDKPAKKYDSAEINKLVNAASQRLLDVQEEDGAWPYEDV